MFDQNGHLRDQAIAALVSGEELDALTRLELAEHLSYCDFCLQRYTDALAGNLLLTPEVSCRHTIWRKIRERTVRTLTSRYATAAAAMALALTLVWADIPLPQRTLVEGPGLTERVEETLGNLLSGVNEFLDGLELPDIGGNSK